MAVKCPKCHSDNPDDTLFCGKCGTQFPSPEEVSISHTKTLLTPTKDLLKGSTFAGRYLLIKELGRGGMGVVYKAEDTKLKRTVALKFLPPELTHIPDVKERFMREAQAAAALDHPNICTVYEFDEAEEKTFISMAYIEGQSLKKRIELGPLNLDEALNIAIQVAEGLREAHKKGVVHRDIKSANIMIDKRDQAKIMDFGLARMTGQTMLTKEGMTMGTIAYMSPEQARGEEVDHRTDIWSLGIVLYEMISGQLPFKGDHEQAIIYSIFNEDPEPVMSLQGGVPMVLQQVANKSLCKNSSERYQRIDEMLVDLKRIRAKKEIKIKPQIRPKHIRRSFVLASSILVFIILSIVAAKMIFSPRGLLPKEKRSIAVMYFENLSNDPSINWMQKGIVELLNAGLSRSQELYVLDTQRLFDIFMEMSKGDSIKIDQASATEVARRANIGTMIVGNIVKIGSKIRLQSKILDADTGEILLAEHADGESDEDIFSMVAYLTDRIRIYLEVKTAREKVDEKWLQDITTNSVEAFRYFVEANEFLYQSFWEDAKHLYEKAVAIDSNFAAAYVYLAATNWNLEDYKAMDSAYNQALRLRNKVSPKERLIIDIFGATKDEDNKRQIILAQELLKYDPKNKLWTYLLGRGYYFSNQLENAIEVWKELSKRRWNWVWTYYYLGDAYLKLNRYEEAIEIYEIGLETIPEYTALYASLSITFFLKEDKARSNFYHEKFLSETKNYLDNAGELYTTAGNVYLSSKMYKKAIDCYKDGLSVLPEDASLYFGLGRVYFARKEYKKAIQEYRKVLKIDSTRYIVYYQLGLTYEMLGDNDMAIEELTRFIEYQKEGASVDDARVRLSKLKTGE